MKTITTAGVIDLATADGITTANPRPEPPLRVHTDNELEAVRLSENAAKDQRNGFELLDKLKATIRPIAKFHGVFGACTAARDRARAKLDATLQAVTLACQDTEECRKLARLEAALEEARLELDKAQKSANGCSIAYSAELNGDSFTALSSVAAGKKLTEANERVKLVGDILQDIENRRDDLVRHAHGVSDAAMTKAIEKATAAAQDGLRLFLEKAAGEIEAMLPSFAECLASVDFVREESQRMQRARQAEEARDRQDYEIAGQLSG